MGGAREQEEWGRGRESPSPNIRKHIKKMLSITFFPNLWLKRTHKIYKQHVPDTSPNQVDVSHFAVFHPE